MCPDFRRARCLVCSVTREEAGGISWSGLCRRCAWARFEANYDAMKSKRGPFAQWWAANLAASVGLGPLDGMPPRP